MNPNNLSGFDPHVQNQLAQLSLNQQGDASSQSSHSASSSVSHSTYYSTYIHPRGAHYSRPSRDYGPYQPPGPPSLDAFPPLGASQPRNRGSMHPYMAQTAQAQQSPAASPADRSHSAAQEFFARARGRGRGRGYHHGSNRSSNGVMNDFARPPPPPSQRLYHPGQVNNFASPEQQRMTHQRLIEQSDYLRAVADTCTSNMLSRHEIQDKQKFAERLESLARQVVQVRGQVSPELGDSRVRLQPYGSLANSFGTAGCDVDLLLTIEPKPASPIEVSEEIKRDLEKALLDQGIGARLLTNTRIPILRVCESPSTELLQNLREHRAKWEENAENPVVSNEPNHPFGSLPSLTSSQQAEQMVAVANLDFNAAEIPLPDSPLLDHSKLEFTGDCGILCDINFTNHVALLNSKLLWTYGQCDPRVRHMGIFVKNWAKARDINTPYRGTLSSYGYILMVLHYLINVANPQLLPNLQLMAKGNGWDESPFELFEGHDVRFTKSLPQIREIMAAMPQNRSSLGALLVGFFRYYGFPQGGFRWNDHAISIRTPGGIVTKHAKEWTRAKWSEANPNVRQRYLLAIEDPFEIDHNVARTVGHHGLCAIRDEFRRAWTIIDSVQCIRTPQGPTWDWQQIDESVSGSGMDFMKPIENRGDLLRKDADGRKEKAEKARLMRQELEMQEELARKQDLQAESNEESGARNGMWIEGEPPLDLRTEEVEDPTLLIHNLQHQDEKTARMRSRRPIRTRLDDVEDDKFDDSSNELPRKNELSATFHRRKSTESTIEPSNVEINNPSMNSDFAFPEMVKAPVKPVENKSFDTMHDSDAASSSVAPPHADQSESLQRHQRKESAGSRWPSHHDVPVSGRAYSPDQVGEHIEWTKNSKAGLWLLNRDARIRAGNFKAPTANDTGRLHATFPYDPTMTRSHLLDLNKKLETFYKTTFYPKKADDLISQATETDNASSHQPETILNKRPIDTAENTLRPEKELKDWPVGEDIPWSGDTEAGQWLLWRDRKIRARNWSGPGKRWNDLAGKLDQLFPHKAQKTLANIERMNSELGRFFSEIQYPRPDMQQSYQYQCANDMHIAIQRTLSDRQSTIAPDHTVFAQVYPTQRKVRFSETRSEISAASGRDENSGDACEAVPSSEVVTGQPQSNSQSDSASWTTRNDVGRWLHWRDAMVRKNAWHPVANSLYAQIDKLYPYSTEATAFDRERQNHELEKFFGGVVMPDRFNNISSDGAYKAILKVFEHRKDERETERVRSLLQLFENDTLNSLNEARGNTLFYRSTMEQEKVDERSMQAVKALSDQLVPSPSHATKPSDDELEIVRQKRLAYYKDKDLNAASKSQFVTTNTHERKDSGAEGSWNYPSSPRSLQSPLDLPEPCADVEKLTANLSQSTGTGDVFRSNFSDDLVTTSDNGTEYISDDFKQDVGNKTDTYEPERLSSSTTAQTSNFVFDPRQLIDIETIMAGGNGCVRGKQSPFMLESDQYSWGGAGAMAQKSNSTYWSCNMKDHERASEKSLGESFMIQRLMEELPDFVQL